MTTAPNPTLASRLPAHGEVDDDDLLELFLDWTIDGGFELYPAQEEAVLELMSGRHLVLSTPTGSGKSLVAVAMHLRGLARRERSVYTAPIKALVSEKFFDLCRTFGAENVGMLTGDATINAGAPVVCCTAEVLANMALRRGREQPFAHVVMDEFHYYADPDRGMAWQIPLLVADRATFLLMSATLGDTSTVEERLAERTGRPVAKVVSAERPVPLEFSYEEDRPLHESLRDLVHGGRSPVYLVNFSQREASEQAQSLMSVDLASKETKRAIADAVRGFGFDSPFGATIERMVRHGVGLHHAGLLPRYRLLVEKLAQQGLLHVISGTDTLGVGVNIPIRTVLLTKLCKFDGQRVRLLTVREFLQVAGRAGRKGFDDRGWVVVQAPAHVIENRRQAAKAVAGRKKKVVKSRPPQRGYVPWDRTTFERLVRRPPEPLKPVFHLDHGILLNLLQRSDDDGGTGGYRALRDIIDASHLSRGRKRSLRRQAAALFRSLRQAGIVDVVARGGGRRGARIVVSDHLQDDFSLHHALSLFLVDAVGLLEEGDADRALDVVTLAESILEHPRPVLDAQVNKRKGEIVARLKAEGVPYEERMEALEGVTWPQPRADWIRARFDAFSATHPWVGAEAIRVKSVARDLIERSMSFNDYVREYRLERFEGVLLRYLTQVYKTLVQVVPRGFMDDDLLQMTATLRAVVARADSSLLVEWEQMLQVPDDLADEVVVERPRRDITRDERAFSARIRAEVHHLVRALADGDWQEAARSVVQTGDDGWTAERFQEALRPFLQTYDRLVFDHRARLSENTLVRRVGPRVWEVTQILCDPEGDDAWSIEATIDLTRRMEVDDSPLLTIRDIAA